MFESLSEKLQGVFRSLRGQGMLTEAQIEAALRQIRLALLEADVHFKVVKDLVGRVRIAAEGQQILRSLTPDQAVTRIVRDEMIATLGAEARMRTASKPPSVVLLVGLQGSGKTTTAAKLGRWLSRNGGHHPILVSTDVQRPAAREQLRSLGRENELKVHHSQQASPSGILGSALAEAAAVGHDVVVVDTAGRLHIDDGLMTELEALKSQANPSEVLYVADAMTGQDAVRSADEFHRRVGLTGIVLTKIDGDARGGAALSATAVTGQPVKFVGTGEKVDDFEPFLPERMVSRILGMGDVLSLIERAEQAVDREQVEQMALKLRRSEFTLEDYRDQLRQIRKLGPLSQVLGMLPGAGKLGQVDTDEGEKELRRTLAIVDSMTPTERREPAILNGSRRKRIARGSGTAVEDVNRMMKQFVQTRKMMKALGGGKGGSKAMRRLAARLPGFH